MAIGRVASLLLIAVVMASCAVPGIAAGPDAGEKLPALNLEAMQSDGTFVPVDAATAAADKPVVYLFVKSDKWDRPVARFMKTFDSKLREYSGTATVTAVWLTNDLAQTKDYLPRAQQSLQFEHTTLAAFADDGAGPPSWNITSDVVLTAVIARGGKTVETLIFMSVNETDVASVGEALQKAVK